MLNISLPEEVQPFLENQAAAAGYGSLGEYVHHLILLEQERLAQQARIEMLLSEGLESGEPTEATDDWWKQKRAQLINSTPQLDP
ncbi:MAG: type II toxin-antitoxin system ParD family antitoxin [Cyanobacteria bacterium P01_A01_bin.17]